jgi:plasmid replication initiation protein
MNTAYEQLQAAGKSLYNRSISFYEASYKRAGKELAKVQMRWVGKVVYHDGEGWIELSWWNDLIPHLTGLKKQFTSYQLEQASALRSAYSWRLLELLTRFESTGWAEYDITDFAVAMDAPPSLMADFGQMKRRIVETAVKELVLKDNWSIEWSTVKKVKKVTAIRFKFERNKQQRLF